MSVRKPREVLKLEQPAEPNTWTEDGYDWFISSVNSAWSYSVEHPVIIIALLALGVSVLSVLVGAWSVWQAKKTSHANIISVFFEEYASRDMLDALDTLRDFGNNNKPLIECFSRFRNFENRNLIVTAADLIDANMYLQQHGAKIEPVRRKVTHFYRRAWRLYKSRYLNKQSVRIIGQTPGFDILKDVAIPLTYPTQLIRICKGDKQKFLSELKNFSWVDEFEKVSRRL